MAGRGEGYAPAPGAPPPSGMSWLQIMLIVLGVLTFLLAIAILASVLGIGITTLNDVQDDCPEPVCANYPPIVGNAAWVYRDPKTCRMVQRVAFWLNTTYTSHVNETFINEFRPVFERYITQYFEPSYGTGVKTFLFGPGNAPPDNQWSQYFWVFITDTITLGDLCTLYFINAADTFIGLTAQEAIGPWVPHLLPGTPVAAVTLHGMVNSCSGTGPGTLRGHYGWTFAQLYSNYLSQVIINLLPSYTVAFPASYAFNLQTLDLYLNTTPTGEFITSISFIIPATPVQTSPGFQYPGSSILLTDFTFATFWQGCQSIECAQTPLPYDVTGLLKHTLEPYQGNYQFFWYNQTDGSYNNCFMFSGNNAGEGTLLPPIMECFNRDEPLIASIGPVFDISMKAGWLAA